MTWNRGPDTGKVSVFSAIMLLVVCSLFFLKIIYRYISVRTLIPSHIDLAGNTSYHIAASRTVFSWVLPYHGQDGLRLLAHVYDSVARIHMTKNPGRHD